MFFHNIWDNPSHWLIFFKMVKATNQIKCLVLFSINHPKVGIPKKMTHTPLGWDHWVTPLVDPQIGHFNSGLSWLIKSSCFFPTKKGNLEISWVALHHFKFISNSLYIYIYIVIYIYIYIYIIYTSLLSISGPSHSTAKSLGVVVQVASGAKGTERGDHWAPVLVALCSDHPTNHNLS